MLPDGFPDSLQACHQLLREQLKQLAQRQELADLLQKTLDDKEELIDKLQVENKLLKRTLFAADENVSPKTIQIKLICL